MTSELAAGRNPGFVQSIINHADTHTPKYGEELTPVERVRIARYADIGGKIPLIGACVGLARLVSSVVIGIIALVGAFFYNINQCLLDRQSALIFHIYTQHIFLRAVDEGARGLLELGTLGCGTFFKDRKQAAKEQSRYIIGSSARGKYVYSNAGGRPFYSDARFIGKANFIYSDDSKEFVRGLQFGSEAIRTDEDEVPLT